MKRACLLVAVLLGSLWSDLAQAQVCAAEPWALAPDGTQCTTANRGRLDANKATCARYGLAAGDTDATQCTQAQACGFSAPGVPACPGGTGCSAVQAIACDSTPQTPSGRRIFPNTTQGREQWAGLEVVTRELAAIKARHAPPPQPGSDMRAWCLNFWLGASQPTRDVECTRALLPPSCDICALVF